MKLPKSKYLLVNMFTVYRKQHLPTRKVKDPASSAVVCTSFHVLQRPMNGRMLNNFYALSDCTKLDLRIDNLIYLLVLIRFRLIML